MSNPRTQTAKRRASFGRAERVRRESGAGRKQSAKHNVVPVPKRRPAVQQPKRQSSRAAARGGSHLEARRQATTLEVAQKRAQSARQQTEQRRQQRLKDQTRTAFNRDADRRRDATRRTEQAKRQEMLKATLKRAEDFRRQQHRQREQRRRNDMRKSFAREAENKRSVHLAAQRKEIERKAATDIERDQKRQQADQKAEHRRQTDAVRLRHQAETRSFRDNEIAAIERHHHAIRRMEEAEARDLHAFDKQRNSLSGRMVERLTGGRQQNDQARQHIRDRHEADRMTRHRELETLKQRQFEIAQKARLQQAMERKALYNEHRTARDALQQRQLQDRPRLIEAGRDAIVAVQQRQHAQERQQVQEREHAREQAAQDREAARPRPASSDRQQEREAPAPTRSFALNR